MVAVGRDPGEEERRPKGDRHHPWPAKAVLLVALNTKSGCSDFSDWLVQIPPRFLQ